MRNDEKKPRVFTLKFPRGHERDQKAKARLRRFAERVTRSFPILVCRRCGSTSVASNVVSVTCFDCFSETPIDGKLFMTVLCRSGEVPPGLERSEAVAVLGEPMSEELEKVLDKALRGCRGNARYNEKERR